MGSVGNGGRGFALRCSLLSARRGSGQFVLSKTLFKEKKKTLNLHTFRFNILHVESAAAGIWNGDAIMDCPHPY